MKDNMHRKQTLHPPIDIAARIRGGALGMQTHSFGEPRIMVYDAAEEGGNAYSAEPADKQNISMHAPLTSLGSSHYPDMVKKFQDMAECPLNAEAFAEQVQRITARYLLARHGAAIVQAIAEMHPENERLKLLATPEYGAKLQQGAPYVVRALEEIIGRLPEFNRPDSNPCFLSYVTRLSKRGKGVSFNTIHALMNHEAPREALMMAQLDVDPELMKHVLSVYKTSYSGNGGWQVDYRPEAIREVLDGYIADAKKRIQQKLDLGRFVAGQFSRKLKLDQPCALPLSDDEARAAVMPVLKELLSEQGLQGTMMRIAAADPTLTIKAVRGNNVTSYHYAPGMLDKNFFSSEFESVGGFARIKDFCHSICVPVNVSKQAFKRILAEELLHHAVAVVYRNDALPYPKGNKSRRMALKHALDMDMQNLEGGMSRLREELDFPESHYPWKSADEELPVKVLRMYAQGEWSEELSRKYPHLEAYVTHIMAQDVDAYLAGQPFPTYSLREACTRVGVEAPKHSGHARVREMQIAFSGPARG